MCQRISAAPPALSRLHRSLTAADLRRRTINDTARGVHGRSKPSMQQRPGRPRNETRAVHVVRAEHHDREVLADDFGLVGFEFVHVDLCDRGALRVGQITCDLLLQPLARVLRQGLSES